LAIEGLLQLAAAVAVASGEEVALASPPSIVEPGQEPTARNAASAVSGAMVGAESDGAEELARGLGEPHPQGAARRRVRRRGRP